MSTITNPTELEYQIMSDLNVTKLINNSKGVWRTIRGSRVFIEDGVVTKGPPRLRGTKYKMDHPWKQETSPGPRSAISFQTDRYGAIYTKWKVNGRTFETGFEPSQLQEGTGYEVMFGEVTRGGVVRDYSLTGKGEAFKVMSTVGKQVSTFIDRYQPSFITFTADEDEQSRMDFYDFLTERADRLYPDYAGLSAHVEGPFGSTNKRYAFVNRSLLEHLIWIDGYYDDGYYGEKGRWVHPSQAQKDDDPGIRKGITVTMRHGDPDRSDVELEVVSNAKKYDDFDRVDNFDPNQLRDERGRWTDQDGNPEPTDTDHSAKEWANTIARSRKGMGSPDLEYNGFDDVLSKHGVEFKPPQSVEENSRLMAEYGIQAGEPKECYEAAGRCFLWDRGGSSSLTYVEGYATSIIPVQHAWVVTEDGQVIDPAWNGQEIEGVGSLTPGTSYFGVPLSTEFVRTHILDSGTWGVFSDFEPSTADLYRNGFPDGALKKMK